jgi:hypothetical protein
VLDLRGVTFMDSSGLGLIVESNQRARKHGFRFAVAVGWRDRRASDPRDVGPDEGLSFVDDPDAFLGRRGRVTREGLRGVRHPRRVCWQAARSGATRSPSTGPAHPLGAPEQWPRSLQTVVQVVLTSRFAMWMAWGRI